MALSASVLKGLIQTNVEAATGQAVGSMPDIAQDVWQAVAEAIITHLTTSAMVVGTATGVTSGGATAPVAGIVT
jgi:hypothetical protein